MVKDESYKEFNFRKMTLEINNKSNKESHHNNTAGLSAKDANKAELQRAKQFLRRNSTTHTQASLPNQAHKPPSTP